jgi:hypothetical protein
VADEKPEVASYATPLTTEEPPLPLVFGTSVVVRLPVITRGVSESVELSQSLRKRGPAARRAQRRL